VAVLLFTARGAASEASTRVLSLGRLVTDTTESNVAVETARILRGVGQHSVTVRISTCNVTGFIS
jgi:hypothetical protein